MPLWPIFVDAPARVPEISVRTFSSFAAFAARNNGFGRTFMFVGQPSMRAQAKLIVLLLLAALVQCGLMDWRPLRAAWFDARAWYYQSRGDLDGINRMSAEATDDMVRQLRAARMLLPEGGCMVEHVCYPDPVAAAETDGDVDVPQQPPSLPQVAPETDDSSDL